MSRGGWAQAARRIGCGLLLTVVAAYLALFTAHSVTRMRNFSPDSMNYVSVARNVSRGLGLSQPALGFNQPRWPVDAALPAPFTSQPPLYPLTVAALGALLPSHADAALLVAALCYAGVLAVGTALAAQLYGRAAGLLALTLLLLHRPLYYVAGFAWSEPLGILLVLLSLLLALRAQRRPDGSAWFWLASGLCAGLAFATRYLLLAAVVSSRALLLRNRRSLRPLLAYAAGIAVPVLLVMGRNLALTGTLMGSRPNPSLLGLDENLAAAFRNVFGSFFGDMPEGPATLLLVAVVTLGLALLVRRRELAGGLRQPGTWLLGAWSCAYLALLIGQRSLIHFDAIGPRLVAPATVTLVLLLAGLTARAFRVRPGLALGIALVVAAGCLARQVRFASGPTVTDAARIEASPRLLWVERNTTAADLIIGDDTMDIPFYLDRPLVVSFSPYPYTDHPTYEHLAAFARGRGYQKAFLVLRDRYFSDGDWRWHYGDFIADLVAGRTDAYPGVRELARLQDGYVFEMAVP